MRRDSPSIRLRLYLSGALTILAALGVAGLGLEHLFARHVERRAAAELQRELQGLIAAATIGPDGSVTLADAPVDPRYEHPFSGSYWQISQEGAPVLRSRSLWDEAIALPEDELSSGGYHTHEVAGPGGQRLLTVERQILVSRPGGDFGFRIAVGVDRRESAGAVADFRADLVAGLATLGVLLMGAFMLAVRFGLHPFERLREALSGLRAGREDRLSGEFPIEVRPLVEDLNALLDHRDGSIERARGRAADLAHGLKTPLAAMTVLADDLRERGAGDLADELSGYAASMTGHVERELMRARMAEAQLRAGPIRLAEALEPILRTMRKLPRGAEIDWRSDVSEALEVRADRAALAEVLGNVLDNARKWARARVRISARQDGAFLVVRIADDGPGVSEQDRERALDRGQRLDESAPGTGFGLSIAADVLEQSGGRLVLGSAEEGGLAVEIRLPAPAREA